MHRFHLRPENWEAAILDADEAHHCLNVLRLSVGDRVTVFDGAGREGQAVIESASGSKAKLKISSTSTTPAPPCAITLAQAVPKGKNMDLIVQKAVELGAARIVPLLSARTVVQIDSGDATKKKEKWSAIALEACKQCGQNRLPEVAEPMTPKAFAERLEKGDLHLKASLQADARPEAVEVTVEPQGQLIQIIAQISQPLRALDHAIKVVAVNHPQLEAFGRGVGRVVQHLDPAKSVTHKMSRKLVVVARHINHAAPFARSAQ